MCCCVSECVSADENDELIHRERGSIYNLESNTNIGNQLKPIIQLHVAHRPHDMMHIGCPKAKSHILPWPSLVTLLRAFPPRTNFSSAKTKSRVASESRRGMPALAQHVTALALALPPQAANESAGISSGHFASCAHAERRRSGRERIRPANAASCRASRSLRVVGFDAKQMCDVAAWE